MQACVNAAFELEKFRGGKQLIASWAWKRHGNLVNKSSGPHRHDIDDVTQKQCFLNIVSDKQNSFAVFLPDFWPIVLSRFSGQSDKNVALQS